MTFLMRTVVELLMCESAFLWWIEIYVKTYTTGGPHGDLLSNNNNDNNKNDNDNDHNDDNNHNNNDND